MHSYRAMHDRVIRLTLVLGSFLVLPFVLGAGQEQYGGKQEFAKFVCQDQTVKIVPINGTDPKAVYLCPGRTLKWDANGHTFTVVFKKKSPFIDDRKIFNNANYQSKPAKNDADLTVYNYDMIVDDQPVDDPQVVGGGGH